MYTHMRDVLLGRDYSIRFIDDPEGGTSDGVGQCHEERKTLWYNAMYNDILETTSV
jgi:hypothetical protein